MMTKRYFIGKIYLNVAFGMLLATLFSYLITTNPRPFVLLIRDYQPIAFGIMFAPLIIALLKNKIPFEKMTQPIKWLFYFIFVLLFTYTLSIFAIVQEDVNLTMVFISATVMFLIATAVGLFTSFDISSWKKMLAILFPLLIVIFGINYVIDSNILSVFIGNIINVIFMVLICVRTHELSKSYDEIFFIDNSSGQAFASVGNIESLILDYSIDMFLWFMYLAIQILARSRRSSSRSKR